MRPRFPLQSAVQQGSYHIVLVQGECPKVVERLSYEGGLVLVELLTYEFTGLACGFQF